MLLRDAEMSLGNVNIPSEEITYDGGCMTLRPLAFWQVCGLFARHAATLVPVIVALQALQLKGESDDLAQVLPIFLQGLADNRDLVFHMIVHSAEGLPEDLAKVASLPAHVQTRALLAVTRLTWGIDFSALTDSALGLLSVTKH